MVLLEGMMSIRQQRECGTTVYTTDVGMPETPWINITARLALYANQIQYLSRLYTMSPFTTTNTDKNVTVRCTHSIKSAHINANWKTHSISCRSVGDSIFPARQHQRHKRTYLLSINRHLFLFIQWTMPKITSLRVWQCDMCDVRKLLGLIPTDMVYFDDYATVKWWLLS